MRHVLTRHRVTRVASLIFRNGPYAGKSLTIPAGKVVTMGRNRDIELPLPDLKLSRRHCQIEAGLAGYILRDMNATNGTYLNGKRITGEVNLRNFDRILIGDTEIEFQCPEEMEEAQTRVGMPEPAKLTPKAAVSDALEPVTTESKAHALAMPQPSWNVAAPTTQAMQQGGAATSAAQAELTAALQELALPMPPEPGAAPTAPAAEKPQLFFCDQCDGSIPAVDLDLGMAKEIDGRLFCRDCLARGASVGPAQAAGALEPFTDVPLDAALQRPTQIQRPAAAGPASEIDDILKGLDDVEEIIVPDGPVKANRVVTKQEIDPARLGVVAAHLSTGSTRRMKPLTPEGQLKPALPPPQVSKKQLDDLLGDDFEELEEIGAPLPPAPAPKPAAKPAPAKPAPAAASEDEDLIEIGSSGP